jgi:hypothetical protein
MCENIEGISKKIVDIIKSHYDVSIDSAKHEIGNSIEIKKGQTSGQFVEIQIFPRCEKEATMMFNFREVIKAFGDDWTEAVLTDGVMKLSGFYEGFYFVISAHPPADL